MFDLEMEVLSDSGEASCWPSRVLFIKLENHAAHLSSETSIIPITMLAQMIAFPFALREERVDFVTLDETGQLCPGAEQKSSFGQLTKTRPSGRNAVPE